MIDRNNGRLPESWHNSNKPNLDYAQLCQIWHVHKKVDMEFDMAAMVLAGLPWKFMILASSVVTSMILVIIFLRFSGFAISLLSLKTKTVKYEYWFYFLLGTFLLYFHLHSFIWPSLFGKKHLIVAWENFTTKLLPISIKVLAQTQKGRYWSIL